MLSGEIHDLLSLAHRRRERFVDKHGLAQAHYSPEVGEMKRWVVDFKHHAVHVGDGFLERTRDAYPPRLELFLPFVLIGMKSRLFRRRFLTCLRLQEGPIQ